MKKIILTGMLLLLAGCASQTSPERHSLYFARHDPAMVGGNYVSKPLYTAKQNLPMYQEVYKHGQGDKVKGLTPEQAKQVADQLYDTAQNSTKSVETFTGNPQQKTPTQADKDSLKLWASTLRDTYLDGYNGIL